MASGVGSLPLVWWNAPGQNIRRCIFPAGCMTLTAILKGRSGWLSVIKVFETIEAVIGLPCSKWSKFRVITGPLSNGDLDDTSEIYARTDYREVA